MSLYCIRRIEDEAYVFSMARGFPGRIIASRTSDKGDCAGKNVFDLLKIPKTEYNFLNDELCEGGTGAIALRTDKDRVAFVFRFFVYGASLLLAIVPSFDARVLVKLCDSGELPDISISPALQKLAGVTCAAEEATEKKICEYMARIFGYADVLAMLCRPGLRPDAHDIQFACDAVGMLIGVDVDNEITYVAKGQMSKNSGVFAGELCLSAMLTYAMVAREYSLDRCLFVEIFYDGEEVFLRFSFCTSDRQRCLEKLELLSVIVKGHRELYFDIGEDGDIWLETWPYYYDVGIAEVKRPELFALFKLHR